MIFIDVFFTSILRNQVDLEVEMIYQQSIHKRSNPFIHKLSLCTVVSQIKKIAQKVGVSLTNNENGIELI